MLHTYSLLWCAQGGDSSHMSTLSLCFKDNQLDIWGVDQNYPGRFFSDTHVRYWKEEHVVRISGRHF